MLTQKQIISAFEFIDKTFETLTAEEHSNYSYGVGIYAILEDAIDQSFGTDEHSKKDFWDEVNSTNEKHNFSKYSFNIVDAYFVSKLESWSQENIRNITIKQLKRICHNTQYCELHTYNIALQEKLCVFKGWIDQIPNQNDEVEIEYLRTHVDSNGFIQLIISIGNTTFTEVTF